MFRFPGPVSPGTIWREREWLTSAQGSSPWAMMVPGAFSGVVVIIGIIIIIIGVFSHLFLPSFLSISSFSIFISIILSSFFLLFPSFFSLSSAVIPRSSFPSTLLSLLVHTSYYSFSSSPLISLLPFLPIFYLHPISPPPSQGYYLSG